LEDEDEDIAGLTMALSCIVCEI